MTRDDLRAERAELYRRRTVQYSLRGAVLDAAAAAGADPSEPLPGPLAKAHEAYTAAIARLDTDIADIDQQIAAAKEFTP